MLYRFACFVVSTMFLLTFVGGVGANDSGYTSNYKGFTRASAVVGPAWVNEVVAGKNPANNPADKYVTLEYQSGPADSNSDYANGHIPGAIHFNSDDFETGYPSYYLKPDADLEMVIKHYGITKNTTVIVYSSRQIAAARGWWILKYAGVEDVRFPDGGYNAWVTAGGSVETEVNVPVPVDDFGGTVPLHPEYLATTSYVETKIAAKLPSVAIADVRSKAEYTGEISGYSRLNAKGRIPTAVWAQEADANDTSAYLNPDGTLRTAEEMATIWNPIGVTADKELIFYCGGGWRSSLAFLYAYLMGYQNVRNYSNGWFEWSTHFMKEADGTWKQIPSHRPIKTGE